ncbi:hypothetical protein ACVWWO_003162 [Bradyrhizobium sp. F1.13.1]
MFGTPMEPFSRPIPNLRCCELLWSHRPVAIRFGRTLCPPIWICHDPSNGLPKNSGPFHSNAFDYAGTCRVREIDQKHFDEVFTKTIYETEHPVVRVHPETGERALVLGELVQRFIDVPKRDGQKLFDLFQSHITAPENTVRWGWKKGDVAIWDNRATQHYAVNDYGDQHRVVHRATIDGDAPVSVDGRCSITRVKRTKLPSTKVA